MKLKNTVKIVLDVIMAILFVLMFKKNIISLSFHEIGGLFIFVLFAVHLILNYKWVIGVTKKLFSKNLPVKTKINWIINALLLVSFGVICISGIFISKVLFAGKFNSGFQWRQIHYFASAFALILTGVHLGLNWGFVMGMFKKVVKIPPRAAKIASIVLLATIFSFGVYSAVGTGFTRWLYTPFLSQQYSAEQHGKPKHSGFEGNNGGENRLNKPYGNNQRGSNPLQHDSASINIINIFKTAGTYLSIMSISAAAAYYISKILGKPKNKANNLLPKNV